MMPPQDDHSGADPTSADAPAGEDRAAPEARPAPDWRNLTDTLTRELQQRIGTAGGDPEKFEETWAGLAAAYGARGAHDVVRLRAGQILNVELDPDLAEKLAHLAHSRHNFLPPPESASAAIPALPHGGEEYRAAGGFVLPPHVRVRVEAAADAMRRELARVYDNPILAEARLHAIAAADRDPAAFTARIEGDPDRLGAIRGDVQDPSVALSPALAHARVAYTFHLSPSAEHAADLMARESLAVVQRAAAEVERAAKALDRVIDLHGPALNEHLRERREEVLGRGASRGPGRGGNGQGPGRHPEPAELAPPVAGTPPVELAPTSAASLRGPDRDGSHGHREGFRGRADDLDTSRPVAQAPAPTAAVPRPAPPVQADPAIEEALRAHTILEEARILAERGEVLRRERGDAQSILAVLDADDAAQLRTSRDAAALARRVYSNPERAMERWEALVKSQGGDTERAQKIVAAKPERLGALDSEPMGGVLGYVPFLRTTAEARTHVLRFAEKAAEYSKARQLVDGPVEWTTPSGERIRGRANVRAAAQEVEQSATVEIDRNNGALLARGGVGGAERQAERAVGSLTPEQRGVLAQRLGAARGVPAAEISASLSRLAAAPRLALQGARLVRAAGEGPGHSL